MSGAAVAFVTLGCKVNQCDSGALAADLAALGLRLVGSSEHADIVVVNTCGVTGRANAQSRQAIRRVKAANPKARIVATGCYAATASAEVGRLPEVDRVVGIGQEEEMRRAIAELAGLGKSRVPAGEPGGTRAKMAVEGHSRAFLKVQEGCDLRCAFCIVPRARGRSRSVGPDEVLAAIEESVRRGFEEVVLCGPNLGSWGRDLRPVRQLADLIDAVNEKSSAPRVRLSSVNPDEFSPPLVDALARTGRLCNHLHIPLQSGDARVLRAMGRGYNLGWVRELMGELLRRIPGVAIGTDVIVGFPGEGARAFAATMEFLAALPLAYMHVFPFSPRPGTRAAKLQGRATGHELRNRVRLLTAMADDMRRRFSERFLGQVSEVLVETKRDRETGLLRGYTSNYIRVLLEGDDFLMGRRVRAELRRIAHRGVLGVALDR